MEEHPILINRPIVASLRGVALCRPSEKALDICRGRNGEFRKEDGQLVVDVAGRRVAYMRAFDWSRALPRKRSEPVFFSRP